MRFFSMRAWIATVTFFVLSTTNALGEEHRLLTVKVDAYSDTYLTLITDAKDNIQGIRISNREYNQVFSPEEFRNGYTKKLLGVRVVSIKSPYLNTATGGDIDIEYRRSISSGLENFHARLRRDESGKWMVESLNQGKARPFKTIEFVIKKKMRMIEIQEMKLSALQNPNAAVAALQGPSADVSPAVFDGASKPLDRVASVAPYSAASADRAL